MTKPDDKAIIDKTKKAADKPVNNAHKKLDKKSETVADKQTFGNNPKVGNPPASKQTASQQTGSQQTASETPKPFAKAANTTPHKPQPLKTTPPVKPKGCFKAALATGLLGILIGAGAGVGGYWYAQENALFGQSNAENMQQQLNALEAALNDDIERKISNQQRNTKAALQVVQQQLQMLAAEISERASTNEVQSDNANKTASIFEPTDNNLEELVSFKNDIQNLQLALGRLENQVSSQQSKNLQIDALQQQAAQVQQSLQQTTSSSSETLLKLATLKLYLLNGAPYADILPAVEQSLPTETVSLLRRYQDTGFKSNYTGLSMLLRNAEKAQTAAKETGLKGALSSMVRVRKADEIIADKTSLQKIRKALQQRNYDAAERYLTPIAEGYNNEALSAWLTQFSDFNAAITDIDNQLGAL